MAAALIAHGTRGHPDENWFPWLKEELGKRGHEVIVPQFPTPEGQELDKWMEIAAPHLDRLGEDSVVVGHSIGPAFLLSVIESLRHPIKAAFFVSGFVGSLNNPLFDKLNRTFAERDFDWERIRKNCRTFRLFHSDNDAYVPLEKAEELARLLDAGLTVVPGAGHFNEDSGYTSFPLLRDAMLEILQK